MLLPFAAVTFRPHLPTNGSYPRNPARVLASTVVSSRLAKASNFARPIAPMQKLKKWLQRWFLTIARVLNAKKPLSSYPCAREEAGWISCSYSRLRLPASA